MQNLFVVSKSNGFDRILGQEDGPLAAFRQKRNVHRVSEDQFVKPECRVEVAAQVETELFQGELLQRGRLHLDPQPQNCGDARPLIEKIELVGRFETRVRNFDRPQNNRIARAETARQRLERLREKSRVLLDVVAACNLALRGVDDELRNRKRGNRIQELGIEHAQECRSDFGKFALDVALNTRRQKCEGFEQPLHLRIGGRAACQFQTLGDFGIAFGELAARFA